MENKKTFGSYIFQRRRELGMTQKDLAEKLYVTESAVSKWERGLSYPDITLLQNICSVLQVTEHELLTGSEDRGRKLYVPSGPGPRRALGEEIVQHPGAEPAHFPG